MFFAVFSLTAILAEMYFTREPDWRYDSKNDFDYR